MLALIDSDILVYRVGFTTEDVSEDIAKWRIDESIDQILKAVKADDYTCYLTSTDKSNFRYKLYPAYKGNRTQPKPLHYECLREHLQGTTCCEVISEMEADDAMGIAQTEDTVICSIDKDLDQIPGKHFNFVKGLLYEVSPEQGLRHFYSQVLTGDRADNVPGIRGIGPKRAESILNGTVDERILWENVQKAYLEFYKGNIDQSRKHAVLNGRLLRIRQKSNEGLWIPPDEV